MALFVATNLDIVSRSQLLPPKVESSSINSRNLLRSPLAEILIDEVYISLFLIHAYNNFIPITSRGDEILLINSLSDDSREMKESCFISQFFTSRIHSDKSQYTPWMMEDGKLKYSLSCGHLIQPLMDPSSSQKGKRLRCGGGETC